MLPTQTQVDAFLNKYLAEHSQESFYLTNLTEAVCNHFSLTEEEVNLKCDKAHGQTSAETTRIEQFTHWGCVHLQFDKVVKRVGPNEWQHVTGPKTPFKTNRSLWKEVSYAMVSVNILKRLGMNKEEIFKDLTGTNSHWPDEILELAITKAFATASA